MKPGGWKDLKISIMPPLPKLSASANVHYIGV
jgi:hypothetical protein